ncbi:hypothetical protein Misp01_03310 [Microtetraspora sp. NBRC 13810]|uniref:hypothetical protein n=1 Tax=Microtetraspora sp. NBRC 13810 TaxID=3030990 RepID=UPI0024A0BE56|nr:hypothetical protein [Microtetraspora sp. NBRC 13810]GLW05201.1 hypothetical protein Misp01_03310 [Microtetraspora sp. NBRC 13810]
MRTGVATAVASLTLAVGSAGCGTGQPAAAAPPARIALPFDPYRLSSEDRGLLRRAHHALTERCMRAHGFGRTSRPMPPAQDGPPQHARRYGVIDEAVAHRFGYHYPPEAGDDPRGAGAAPNEAGDDRRGAGDEPREAGGDPRGAGDDRAARSAGREGGLPAREDGVSAREDGMPARERAALHGTATRPGCRERAGTWLAAGAPQDDMRRLESHNLRTVEESAAHPDVLRARDAWRACMLASGFDYADPRAAVSDRRWALDAPTVTPGERATAVADVRCKHRSGLVAAWLAAESALQSAVIARDPDRFARLLTYRRDQLTRARRILATTR